jgi:hypothetical protein
VVWKRQANWGKGRRQKKRRKERMGVMNKK